MDLGGVFKPKPKDDHNNPQNSSGANIPATSSATQPFSGIGRHINASLKKIGAKNIETGIGSGVGLAGFAPKPGVVHQFQLYLLQNVGKMMTKFGVSQSFGQSILTTSSMLSRTSALNQNMLHYVGEDNPIQRFLGNKNESIQSQGEDEQLQSKTKMLEMVLRHEQVIEELLEENKRFRRILVEDLHISPAKLHSRHSTNK